MQSAQAIGRHAICKHRGAHVLRPRPRTCLTQLTDEDALEITTQVRPVYVQKGRILEVMGNYPAAVENYRTMVEFAGRHGDAAMQADGLNHLVTAQVVLTGPTPDTESRAAASVGTRTARWRP